MVFLGLILAEFLVFLTCLAFPDGRQFENSIAA
jgi:hypothetical protein